MASCSACELPVENSFAPETANRLCEPCRDLDNQLKTVSVRPLQRQDLELVLAWRSNPEIYQYFRKQNGPLDWADHVSWFESRDQDRFDFVVRYENRRVGVVSLDSKSRTSIYLGDFSARGNGVATVVLDWLCSRFREETPIFAEIHTDNTTSIRLFERCEFERRSGKQKWLNYVYNL